MGRKVTKVAFGAPELPRDKNVAAYCRVSSGKDAMLHSLEAQVSYYSGLIQKPQRLGVRRGICGRGADRDEGHQGEFRAPAGRLQGGED